MSAALQSLICQIDAPALPRARSSGLISFLVIGAGAAAAFAVADTLAATLVADGPGWLMSAICLVAVLLPAYALHKRISFRSTMWHRVALPRYLAVQAMALLLAALFGFASGGTIALPSPPVAILVLALTSGVNFLILKSWAFAPGPLLPVPAESH